MSPRPMLICAFLLLAGLSRQPAIGGTVTWTDWHSGVPSAFVFYGDVPTPPGTIPAGDGYFYTIGTATGTMGGVTVNYSGDLFFVRSPDDGFDEWAFVPDESLLSSTIENRPTPYELIGLIGYYPTLVNTLTFSSPVTDPVMAVYSLGSGLQAEYYNFDTPFDIVSTSFGLSSVSGNRLHGTGGDGVIQFRGTVTAISWTVEYPEQYHGFTVGLLSESDSGPDPSPVPEPASALLLGIGVVPLAAVLQRRAKKRRA
jgi:hypothetical protein